MHWIRAALLLLAVLLLGVMAAAARADEVVLTNGNKFEGEITSKKGEFPIVIKTKGGKLTFPERLVKSVKRDGSDEGAKKPVGGGARQPREPRERPEQPRAGGGEQVEDMNWLQLRRSYKTKLLRKGAAPGKFTNPDPKMLPPGVTPVTYRSGPLKLKGWVVRDPRAPTGPGLVYFHGGGALNLGDSVQICTPFVSAGFAVFFPALRGENGNPGIHELAAGEVDDAVAAVKWLAKQTYVKQNAVHALGYNLGGLVASLLSLSPAARLASSASVDGLYAPKAFAAFGDQLPFNPRIKQEAYLRSMIPHRHQMRHTHYAYVSKRSQIMQLALDELRDDPRRKQLKLKVVMSAGQGEAMLREAVQDYLRRIQ